jgi:hypothetical protein
LRRGEPSHPRGRSRRPMLASTRTPQNPPQVNPVRCTGLCRHANHWKCPVVMVFIPLARRHGRRVSVALSVDRQSTGGVNFRRTTRRRFGVWLSRAGKAWEDRSGRAIRHPLPSGRSAGRQLFGTRGRSRVLGEADHRAHLQDFRLFARKGSTRRPASNGGAWDERCRSVAPVVTHGRRLHCDDLLADCRVHGHDRH